MVDKDPSKPTRSIARDMGVFGFLSGRLCIKTFAISHMKWERVNFYHGPERTRIKTMLKKFFNKLKHPLQLNILCEKFLPGADGEFTEQPLACFIPTRCTESNENQTPSSHHSVRVITSNGNMLPFTFPLGLKFNMKTYIKCLKDVVLP